MGHTRDPSLMEGPSSKNKASACDPGPAQLLHISHELQRSSSVDLRTKLCRTGDIADLFNCCIYSCRSLVKHACRGNESTEIWSNSLRNDCQLLCLWGNDFDVGKGGLDRRLELSQDLALLVFSMLTSLGRSISRCYKYKRMFEHVVSSMSDLELNMSRLDDALKACKPFRRDGSASDNGIQDEIEDESDSESDDGSQSQSDDESDEDEIEGFQDLLEDIKTFTRGLLDLSPSIDSPAKDRQRDCPSSTTRKPVSPLTPRSSNPQKFEKFALSTEQRLQERRIRRLGGLKPQDCPQLPGLVDETSESILWNSPNTSDSNQPKAQIQAAQSHGKATEATSDPPKKFKCHWEGCSLNFTREHNLRLHIRMCHPYKRAFSCSSCQESFNEKDDLMRHKKSIHSGKPRGSIKRSMRESSSSQNTSQTQENAKEESTQPRQAPAADGGK